MEQKRGRSWNAKGLANGFEGKKIFSFSLASFGLVKVG